MDRKRKEGNLKHRDDLKQYAYWSSNNPGELHDEFGRRGNTPDMDMGRFEQRWQKRRVVIANQNSFPFMSSKRRGVIHHTRTSSDVTQDNDHRDMLALRFATDTPNQVERCEQDR
jgi:hypothetical protein